jgi:hypothetical protein
MRTYMTTVLGAVMTAATLSAQQPTKPARAAAQGPWGGATIGVGHYADDEPIDQPSRQPSRRHRGACRVTCETLRAMRPRGEPAVQSSTSANNIRGDS